MLSGCFVLYCRRYTWYKSAPCVGVQQYISPAQYYPHLSYLRDTTSTTEGTVVIMWLCY